MKKFENTNIFRQIDWEKEIVDKEWEKISKNKDIFGVIASDQVMCYSYVEMLFEEHIKNAKDDNTKANITRVLEYFYARFVYSHALFYDKFKDLKEDYNKKIKERRFPHPIKVLHKKFGKLPLSILPLEHLRGLEIVFLKHVEEGKDKTTDEEFLIKTIALFKNAGLDVKAPIGTPKYGDRTVVSLFHDDVQYMFYSMKSKDNDDKIKNKVIEYTEAKNKYHDLIKNIYNKIALFDNIGDIWVMVSGTKNNTQLFFGNKNGYLCIVYVRNINSAQLQVQFYKNDHYFKSFKIPGVNVRTSESVYGKDI